MYHSNKCQSMIRRKCELKQGINPVTIIVTGQHAFKRSITIIKPQVTKSLTFSNRELALKELIRLKAQFRQFGDVNF